MNLIQTTRYSAPVRTSLTAVCCLSLTLLVPSTAAPAEPRPSSHRYIPARGLVAYLEFDGLDAHSDAWKATAALAMLTNTRAGATVTEVAESAGWLGENLGLLTRTETVAVGDHLIRKGFVLAIHKPGVNGLVVTLVLNRFGGTDVRDRFLTSMLFGADEKGGELLHGPVRLRGRNVFMMREDEQPPAPARVNEDMPGLIPDTANDKKANMADPLVTAWVEGDDLIVIMWEALMAGPGEPEAPKTLAEMRKDYLTLVFDAIEGKVPNVTKHAGYLSALAGDQDIKGFEPTSLFFAGPTDNKGLFTAMTEWFPDTQQKTSPQQQTEPQKSASSPARPPAVADKEVHKAAGGTSSPRPAFPADDFDRMAPGLARVLAGESGKGVQLPGRTELASEYPVWAYIEARGIEDIKGIAGRWGFQGKALLTHLRIEAPVPRKVLSVCLDQPALNKAHLPPIPSGVKTFVVASFDPAKNYQTLSNVLNSIGSRGTDEIRRIEKLVRDETQLRLREDLLKHVGPTWWAFPVPSRKADGHEPNKAGPAANVLLAGVDDAEAFAKVLDALAPRVNQYLRDLDAENAANGQDKKGEASREIGLERLPAPARGYRLTAACCRAIGLNAGVEPVILVENSFMAVAANLDRAREALASTSRAEGSRKPSDELAKVLDGLPEGLTFLAVADPRASSLPYWIVSLPSMLKFVWNMNVELADTTCLDDLIGIARPGGLGEQIKPSPTPEPDDLRPYLFPSVLAATVDDRGCRLISRQAFPLELLTP